MKRFYLISILSATLFAFGCAGNTGSPSSANSAANGSENRAVAATSSATSEANAGIPGITAPPSNADSKGIQQQRLSEKSGGTDAQVAEASRDAPDNSTFSSRLTDVAVETRTFRSHPQLIKVVKTIAPGKTEIKVYLKGGKVVEVPADKIANLATIQAVDILSLVGISPPPASSAAPGKYDGQKQ